jgi:hypothetical protein
LRRELLVGPDIAEAAVGLFLDEEPRTVALAGGRTFHAVYARLASETYDWPSVVRVHQAQAPELVALVHVRHTRRGELQQHLCQGVEPSVVSHAPVEGSEVVEEAIVGLSR